MSHGSPLVAVARVAALLAVLVRSTAGGDTPQIYAHGLQDRQAIVQELATRSAQHAGTLVVFDTATFDPPPGENEFKVDHRYRDDLPGWMGSLRILAAKAKSPVYAATMTSHRIVRVEGDDWQAAIEGELAETWWQSPKFTFEPAANALSRLVGQAGRKCLVVVVSGDVLPEQTVKGLFDPSFGGASLPDDTPESVRKILERDAQRPHADESWRKRLLPVGEYWDEEKVAKVLRGRAGTLVVIAPEARFCDFLPAVEIPDVPWASRPIAPPPVTLNALAQRPEDLEEMLKPLFPDEGERKRALEHALKSLEEAPEDGLRFLSNTPTWCVHYGQGVFFNTDCPSGFGYWPFARAAAATGGRYLFYPFPPGKWLDACPRDPALMRRLAPELVPKRDYVNSKRNDAALDAICDACRDVIEETPWADSARGDPRNRAPGWMLFKSTKPLVLHDGVPVRDRPTDEADVHDCSRKELKERAEELSRSAKRYDHAIGILESAAKSIKGGPGGVHPRSEANLLLTRFWFEMSAFHLDALSLFLEQKAADEGTHDLVVTYAPAIRLSDCLDSYTGLTITPKDEAKYASGPEQQAGCQGNFLEVQRSDPKYRAKRDVEQVLKNLDPRLRERALRMIRAAEAVMERYAQSPWGWVVYYSEADTFVSQEMTGLPVEGDRVGVDILRPKTPRPGSKGAGPTSGGG